jgi:quercetin dioxygenase-like cupin family protein
MPMNRRNLLSALSAMALLTTVADAGAQTEEHTGPPTPDSVPMDKSIVFRFADMHVNHYDTGGWGRQVMHGTLPTGEFVEVHETMLPAGKMPHPPHRHRNTEFLLIRQGTLEFLNNGTPEPVGVGDVVYTASNQLHGLKNVGTTDALYFVVSISHGQM